MDAEELALFARTVRRAAGGPGTSLDAELDALGWADALAADRRAAIAVVFECQGETNATSSALDDVVAGALRPTAGTAPAPATGAAPTVATAPAPGTAPADGADSTAVVLPPPDRWDPPGELGGGRLSVRGLATGRATGAGTVVVATRGPGQPGARAGAAAVAVETSGLTLRPVSGMDPWLGLVEVTGTALEPVSVDSLGPDAWPDAVRAARLAVAHELVGASRAMLELARGHALERVQFGRPIGTFQAVRHRLADSLVAIEAAAATLDAAWEDDAPQVATVAKGVAGRNARTVARHCQQVLAGMGFTTEHPFHRYLRRVLVLDELFGSARSVTRALGAQLVAARRLPPALAL